MDVAADKPKILGRDQILKAEDIKREFVDMSYWWGDGGVVVRGMTGKQRGRFEAKMGLNKGKDQQKNWERFRAEMLVETVVDYDDQPIFRLQDVEALNEKSAEALDHLVNVARRLSGYRKEDVDEMTKNSQEDQSDDFI
jgi:hypothetical protein